MIRFLKFLLFIPVSLICAGYYFSERFSFPEPKPFIGEIFYNPYEEGIGPILKANFHAHSKSWGGLTNGAQSGDEVIRHYLEGGYDVASISDYHHINEAIYAKNNIAIPTYEHGVNLSKTHYLALNVNSVSFQDVFLFHTDHTRQTLINRLQRNSDIVCINHPEIRNGHLKSSLQILENYSHLELINGSKFAAAHWDSALSAGKPVWALSNDDMHNVMEKKFGKSWTAICVESKDQKGVINSLKRGSTFAVHQYSKGMVPKGNLEEINPIPKSIQIINNHIEIQFRDTIESIQLIGQGGRIRFSAIQTDNIQFRLEPSDTYIRGQFTNQYFKVFSNPIIRMQNNNQPINHSGVELDIIQTTGFRTLILILWAILFKIFFPGLITTITLNSKNIAFQFLSKLTPHR